MRCWVRAGSREDSARFSRWDFDLVCVSGSVRPEDEVVVVVALRASVMAVPQPGSDDSDATHADASFLPKRLLSVEEDGLP